ncbi:type I modular polyketide synthase [Mycobacterium tuberculosis]|nr:type I modular polyketide synthase [Mycobacterium tuberculosis]
MTQAALFAVQVAVYRQLEVWGLSAGWLGGHSIGELTAAYLAGVWDLEGACRVVSARGRLMGRARAGGAMAALEATEAQVRDDLTEGVGIAAVNGPTSIVVSGDADAVDALVEQYKQAGRRARRLTVSHAFHSHHMDEVLGEFEEIVASVPAAAPRLKLVSTLTGTELADQATQASYWARQVREAVRFRDAVEFLAGQGVNAFLDVSPDGVLTSMISAAAPETATVISTLRKDIDEPTALTHATARLFQAGADVAWTSVLGGEASGPVGVPTYAFEHTRYWIDVQERAGDVRAAGLGGSDHPLLGARVGLAGGGCVLTGRLARSSHRWLGDHAVAGTVLLPGTSLVELAIRAADEVGCGTLRELTLQAPVVVPAKGAVQVQVRVGASAEEDGAYDVTIHSRLEDAADDGAWILHASGVLSADTPTASTELASWRPPQEPAGTERIALDGLYDRLADAGFDYGPLFQGLRQAWRRNEDEVFVEVSLPEEDADAALADAGTDSFGIHPALLDAVLHGVAVSGWAVEHPGLDGLPFAWSGVALHASGARLLRARLAKAPGGGLSIVAVDGAGAPVIDVERLVLRPLPEGALAAAGAGSDEDAIGNDVFQVSWAEVSPHANADSAAAGAVPWAVLRSGDALADIDDPDSWVVYEPGRVTPAIAKPEAQETEPVAARVRQVVAEALDVAQQWVAAERGEQARLVVMTRGAVATGEPGELSDLAGAAVWGLIRTAQSEHPGRIVLVDLDEDAAAADDPIERAVAAATSAGAAGEEPQVALRGGRVVAARLARVPVDPAQVLDADGGWDPDGTVLITGGTGGLGALVARHLVCERGVRSLVLVSRSGLAAGGAADLAMELAQQGARVRVLAADVADRAALAAVVAAAATADPARPLRGVVHAAGVLDDGTLETLTPERLDTVMRVKADAAWALHELTADLPLTRFVLFSSASAAFGAPGQGNYAAGNAFLDALATWRSAGERASVSLAWGLWEQESGMGGRLGAAQIRRLAQTGAALSTARGLALFDLGAALGLPALVLTRLDLRGWRNQAAGSALAVPALLGALVPARTRRAADRHGTADGGSEAELLARRLAGLDAGQRRQALVDAVRTQVAAVLGYPDAASIDLDLGFLDLGFDSLTAVELRNRLRSATGCKLPATLTFDYPTPVAVAERIGVLLEPRETALAGSVSMDPAEAEIRGALQSIPLSRLRQAGLMEVLLRLARPAAAPATGAGADRHHGGPAVDGAPAQNPATTGTAAGGAEGEVRDVDDIDEMDVDALVRRALHDSTDSTF